jgi:ketosteroid isomerase-like protein
MKNANLSENFAEILQLVNNVAETWKKGDVDKLSSYFTEDMIYIYSEIMHGNDNFMRFLKENYPKAEMGEFEFLEVEVKVLSQYAIAYGKWSWSNQKGIKSHGTFSWLCFKTTQGWKITMDHTTQIND